MFLNVLKVKYIKQNVCTFVMSIERKVIMQCLYVQFQIGLLFSWELLSIFKHLELLLGTWLWFSLRHYGENLYNHYS